MKHEQKIRMYNLDDRSVNELKELLEQVKTHFNLTFEEKKANIEAINSKLGILCFNEDKRKAIIKDIEDGSADIDDAGGF